MSTRADLPDLRGVVVLVVEDDPDAAELVSMALQMCGATVHAAPLVQRAKTLLGEVRPDAILCDLSLPGEDGIAFAAWVRQPRELGGNAAIIAYTAYDAYFRRAVTPGGGFAAVVKKPSDPGYVCTVVADIVRGPPR